MRDLESLKSELNMFQEHILYGVKPYHFRNQSFLHADEWHSDSPKISVKSDHNTLSIKVINGSQEEIYYREKNSSLKHLYNELKVLPNEELEVRIEGNQLGEVYLDLKIIEYSNAEKVNTYLVPFNENMTIKTTDRTNIIRLSLQAMGTGTVMIEELRINRMKEPIVNHSLLSNHYMKKIAPEKISDVKMGCILDEVSMSCFGQEVNLIPFTTENWQEVLTDNIPDVLLVESAWRGNFGAWEYKIAKYKNQDQTPLIKLLEWCKKINIPTVFWNHEDPTHFNRFIDTAKLFDYIFTTDANMMENYHAAVSHKNIFILPFSAEPKLHNPIKIQKKRMDKLCLAGSISAHEDSNMDIENILDAVSKFGIDLFEQKDVNNVDGTTLVSFPERFSDQIVGNLKNDEMVKAYKGYKGMLNVDSLTNSPKVVSRQVFEGLACGTPMISRYSEGVKNLLKDIVIMSENQQELERNIHQLMTDDDYYRLKSLDGLREVYLHHTYKHRIQYMFEKIGVHFGLDYHKVSVISVVRSKEEFAYILEEFESQTWKEKEWIVLLESFDGYIDLLNQYNNENIKTYVLSYMDHYSRITDLITSEYVAYFSPDHFYGDNYLLDMMLATEYSTADMIGKGNRYSYDSKKGELEEIDQEQEYEYVSELHMDFAVIKVDIFHGENLIDIINNMKNKQSTTIYYNRGFRLLSVDKYNFIQYGFGVESTVLNKIQK